jgi:UDP-N-acetylmuramyl tripeptide synthase
MMRHKDVTRIGKVVRHVSRLRGGSGSALPGLVIEKIDPHYAKRTLESLPHGVVVVTGTNGKTTTTKIVCSLLESAGLRVFTNKTGSNFTRGVIAALLADVNQNGILDADIAVVELDEAYAAQFVKTIRPRYSLLLNVMRDQLDRFGEIDHTARLLQVVAEATTDTVVMNNDDPLIRSIADVLPKSTHAVFYGISPALQDMFPSDQQLYGDKTKQAHKSSRANSVTLEKVEKNNAWFTIDEQPSQKVPLKLQGVYNMQNAAGALALVHSVVQEIAPSSLLKSLETVQPAFGRGEAIEVNGHPLEIVLVKNPAGFRLALQSYSHTNVSTMVAINDNYADGRDMSWLWDVDFTALKSVHTVSGIRAYDMALRLQYDDIVIDNVDPNLSSALTKFIDRGPAKKRIFCTYTAMMTLRKLLAKRYHVEDIDR